MQYTLYKKLITFRTGKYENVCTKYIEFVFKLHIIRFYDYLSKLVGLKKIIILLIVNTQKYD